MPYCRAHVFFETPHFSGLLSKIRARDRVHRRVSMAFPNDAFDVVLKEDCPFEARDIDCRRKKVTQNRVKCLPTDQTLYRVAHLGGAIPRDGNWLTLPHPAHKLNRERRGTPTGNLMADRIRARTVLTASLDACRLIGIMECYVVNLMAFMQPSERFKRPNLPSSRGWMEEIRFDPQDFHLR
jgi:hypothetical protein